MCSKSYLPTHTHIYIYIYSIQYMESGMAGINSNCSKKCPPFLELLRDFSGAREELGNSWVFRLQRCEVWNCTSLKALRRCAWGWLQYASGFCWKKTWEKNMRETNHGKIMVWYSTIIWFLKNAWAPNDLTKSHVDMFEHMQMATEAKACWACWILTAFGGVKWFWALLKMY